MLFDLDVRAWSSNGAWRPLGRGPVALGELGHFVVAGRLAVWAFLLFIVHSVQGGVLFDIVAADAALTTSRFEVARSLEPCAWLRSLYCVW